MFMFGSLSVRGCMVLFLVREEKGFKRGRMGWELGGVMVRIMDFELG